MHFQGQSFVYKGLSETDMKSISSLPQSHFFTMICTFHLVIYSVITSRSSGSVVYVAPIVLCDSHIYFHVMTPFKARNNQNPQGNGSRE